MKTTTGLDAAVIRVLLEMTLLICFVSTIAFSATRGTDLPQAVVTYGFLASKSADFPARGVWAQAATVVGEMAALGRALESLNCDVTTRLGSAHRVFVVPVSPVGQWIGYVRKAETPPTEGSLFVTEPFNENRVLVVLSSVAPEWTTVFWVEARDQGYGAGLVYDSFKRGKISNVAHSMIGAVTCVSVADQDAILLREWAEPGSRPTMMGDVGRVFRLDLKQEKVTLESTEDSSGKRQCDSARP
jgi:hypothetical protein